ncbi:Integral membrane protein [Lactobacillus helsingborgensis]|uniref:Threonine/serine exporter family protein n=1 Tax=Lactobacillus helsingborgensis TaxID=1218494 RepID=A0A0F4LXB2_9LACO|nr:MULTISPECIES: threonine/serine exporter family protein [Lactobacillus]MEB3362872.1 threonine/serine exporter family protein [Lactobacillus sp. R2/2]AWN34009.1 threonine/serine exporter [Lactobacillus helsingborgensis]KJY62929.1 Integral membrane protein [Lactobacillus helsingborgensis]MBC6357300.1 threonine/serine exporter [Lactobacillus helsingborgensis]MBI0110314.1 threonine/serine exporter family protein [Lactobacillus sp. W8093]
MDATKRGETFYQDLLDTCLTAGELMIEGGSEMYRVEDTMMRIAKSAGEPDPRVFVVPTGVFMSLDHGNYCQTLLVHERNINLELVDRINSLSRAFAEQKITLQEVKREVNNIASGGFPTFPVWLQTIGAAILSATLMVMFMNNYDWIDFPAAAIVGATGFISFYYFKRFTNVKFLSELVAAVIMTVLAAGLVHIFPQMIIDHILTGALMPLVPGLALTNALRDLFKGDILSGMVKICEALLTAFALGGGVGIVLKFLGA